jgi:hypothetical protein
VFERVGLERLAAGDPIQGAIRESALLLQCLPILAVDHGQVPF